ncbi:hypothetical protein L1887_62127 [Cichorium endivia]|nr:hypothetical protein L1887_62127 [Cichorium endivia]
MDLGRARGEVGIELVELVPVVNPGDLGQTVAVLCRADLGLRCSGSATVGSFVLGVLDVDDGLVHFALGILHVGIDNVALAVRSGGIGGSGLGPPSALRTWTCQRDETTAVAELVEAADEDLELERMETDSVVGRHSFQMGDVLADGAVTRAGDVGQDAVVLHGGLDDLGTLVGALVGDLDGLVVGRIEVGDQKVGRGEALGLVDEHMGALCVGVVGDDETGGHGGCRCWGPR